MQIGLWNTSLEMKTFAKHFKIGMQQEFRKSGIPTGFWESGKIRNPKSGE